MKSSDVRYHGKLYTSNQIFLLMKHLAKRNWNVTLWIDSKGIWYVQVYSKDMSAGDTLNATGPWKALQKVMEQVIIPYEDGKK
jgi:hypothetical protein